MMRGRHECRPLPRGLGRTEHAEQVAVIRWAKVMEGKHPELALLFAIPNGGHRRKTEAARLSAEGVKAGVPDLCLPVKTARYGSLFIEMKRDRRATVKEHQRDWINALRNAGNRAEICRGFEEAQAVILEHLAEHAAYMDGKGA